MTEGEGEEGMAVTELPDLNKPDYVESLDVNGKEEMRLSAFRLGKAMQQRGYDRERVSQVANWVAACLVAAYLDGWEQERLDSAPNRASCGTSTRGDRPASALSPAPCGTPPPAG